MTTDITVLKPEVAQHGQDTDIERGREREHTHTPTDEV
jgi:hypothetical protein